MNTEYIPFPPNARRFHLRSDFSDEILFFEYSTSRKYSNEQFRAVLNGTVFPTPLIDAYDEDLVATYQQPRFFAYMGLGVKGCRSVLAYVTNGNTWMPTEKAGLFQDLLARVKQAEGRCCEKFLFPAEASSPRENWVFPSYSVLHDTAFSSAAFLPYKTAMQYVRRFNK